MGTCAWDESRKVFLLSFFFLGDFEHQSIACWSLVFTFWSLVFTCTTWECGNSRISKVRLT